MGTNLIHVRRNLARLAVGAVMLAAGVPAFAGTVNTGAEAVVVRRLSFIQVDDLMFGNMLPGTTAGTVVVAPNGVRTKTGGPVLMGGTVQASSWAGWGTFNQNVQITMSANSYTLTRVGGTQTMAIDTFIIGSTPTAQLTTTPRVFRIGATNGIFQFPVGATLRVGANQMPGNYRGTMTITLNYQ